LAVARARLDQAKAEMVMAKFHLSATNIKAPFSGTIDRILKKLGSLIDEGELLTSLLITVKCLPISMYLPEYLDYEIKNRAQNQVGLLLANGVP
jgi:membrane fusion protein (multidrug efflux system)